MEYIFYVHNLIIKSLTTRFKNKVILSFMLHQVYRLLKLFIKKKRHYYFIVCNFLNEKIDIFIMVKAMYDATFHPSFLLTASKCLFQSKIIRTAQELMPIRIHSYCTNDTTNSAPQLFISSPVSCK